MKLLAILATLSQPGSGSVFDPTTPPIIVNLPLTQAPGIRRATVFPTTPENANASR